MLEIKDLNHSNPDILFPGFPTSIPGNECSRVQSYSREYSRPGIPVTNPTSFAMEGIDCRGVSRGSCKSSEFLVYFTIMTSDLHILWLYVVGLPWWKSSTQQCLAEGIVFCSCLLIWTDFVDCHWFRPVGALSLVLVSLRFCLDLSNMWFLWVDQSTFWMNLFCGL